MQEVRRRKKEAERPIKKTEIDVKKDIDNTDVKETAANGTFWTIPYVLFGLAVAGLLGYGYADFIKLLHENDMWFSEISVSEEFSTKLSCIVLSFTQQEVEREISFRTESGLYYSYYKQLVNTPSFVQGNTGMHTVLLCVCVLGKF